jgi:hypothetical protein
MSNQFNLLELYDQILFSQIESLDIIWRLDRDLFLLRKHEWLQGRLDALAGKLTPGGIWVGDFNLNRVSHFALMQLEAKFPNIYLASKVTPRAFRAETYINNEWHLPEKLSMKLLKADKSYE